MYRQYPCAATERRTAVDWPCLRLELRVRFLVAMRNGAALCVAEAIAVDQLTMAAHFPAAAVLQLARLFYQVGTRVVYGRLSAVGNLIPEARRARRALRHRLNVLTIQQDARWSQSTTISFKTSFRRAQFHRASLVVSRPTLRAIPTSFAQKNTAQGCEEQHCRVKRAPSYCVRLRKPNVRLQGYASCRREG